MKQGTRIRAWLVVLFVGLALTWLTLGHDGPAGIEHKVVVAPLGTHQRTLNCLIDPVACVNLRSALVQLLIDGVGNVAVFVPFGAAVALAIAAGRRRVWWGTAAGLVLSVAFEMAQLWIPGRVVATDDVILNTCGAWLGALLISAVSNRKSSAEITILNNNAG